MNKNEKGFTLTEILIVLSAFLIISSIGAMQFKAQFLNLEKSTFFSQLKSDLLFAQSYAISHQEIIIVNIMDPDNSYYIRENASGSVLISRTYSKEVLVKEGTMPLYFQFSPDGNINRFGSFLVEVGRDIYRFQFLVGMGRFNVTKE